MIRSQFNYRTVGRLTHRAFYCFPTPPRSACCFICAPRCTVPMCVAPPVCLVSLFTRKQGHLTVCTEGHRVPYCDLAHHLESRVRASCRVLASSGLAIHVATGFKTRKCNLNAILRRFRSKRARTNQPRTNNASHESMVPPHGHASCSFWQFGTEMADEAFE